MCTVQQVGGYNNNQYQEFRNINQFTGNAVTIITRNSETLTGNALATNY